MNLKDGAITVASILLLICVMVGTMYGYNRLSSTAVSVQVVSPKSGRECAVATSHDNVAIDCWEVPQ